MNQFNSHHVETIYSGESRTERLTALARTALAGFFLLLIWLDPPKPSGYSPIIYILSAGYLGYAFVLTTVNWQMKVPLRHFHIITHALDLMVFAGIMFIREAPGRPLVVYFIFPLVCAAWRWKWRGTLLTGAVALVAIISLAMYPTVILRKPNFELNRFVIHILLVALVTILLGYTGAYVHKLRDELSKLAEWPRTVRADVRELVQEMLEYAAVVLESPRMLLAWREGDEPWLHLASWSAADFHCTRQPHAVFGTLVAEPLAGTSFFCPDTCSPLPVVVLNSPTGLKRWRGAPLDPQFQKSFNIGAVLSLRLQGDKAEGYLLVIDKPQMAFDDLLLGEIVAQQVLAGLDCSLLLKQLQQAAATEERIRLARDLHDGLLQSLTGVALQLETVYRLIEVDPQTGRQRLQEIQQMIASEQLDLRSQIRELKPSPPNLPEMDSELATHLEQLAERINRHWGLRVEVNLKRLEPRIPRTLSQEIYFIIHESVINAARHAKASAVRVELAVEDNGVRIMVADDGRGFPFHGHYDHTALTKMKLGPVTLKERIVSLGGSLAIDSNDTGARLEITLPLTENGG